MKLFKLNPIKKKAVYHYSKIAPYGKILKMKVDEGIIYFFRSRTSDRTALKEIWARKIYSMHGFGIAENDVVIDAGGHIGVFSAMAAHKATAGRVFAFEPMKDNFDLLRKNTETYSNVHAENMALSNANGERTFYLSKKKIFEKAGYSTGGHSFYQSGDREKRIKVQTSTLDSIVEQHKIQKINYLKIDAEGAEFDILFSTSKETMQKIDKIVMELHPFGENTIKEMLDFLETHGYETIADAYGGSEFMVYARR